MFYMKKLFVIGLTLAAHQAVNAQTIQNPSFETWRVSSAGITTATAKVVRAPSLWFGADSLIIANGQAIGSIVGISPTVWQQQLFKDSTSVHTGSYAAKLVTADQDTLGIFPGILSNAQAHVTVSLTGISPITFTGGTAVTRQVSTVTAWVKYSPASSTDSGVLSIQAYKRIGGVDSVIGLGRVAIGASTTYTQVTANMVYTTPGVQTDTLRINFASSLGGAASAVGSTLWVDDVAMTNFDLATPQTEWSNTWEVYPNPAENVLNIGTTYSNAYYYTITALNGAVVASGSAQGNAQIALAGLTNGIYFYNLATEQNASLKSGVLQVAH